MPVAMDCRHVVVACWCDASCQCDEAAVLQKLKLWAQSHVASVKSLDDMRTQMRDDAVALFCSLSRAGS